jgi:hypothetical protein
VLLYTPYTRKDELCFIFNTANECLHKETRIFLPDECEKSSRSYLVGLDSHLKHMAEHRAQKPLVELIAAPRNRLQEHEGDDNSCVCNRGGELGASQTSHLRGKLFVEAGNAAAARLHHDAPSTIWKP